MDGDSVMVLATCGLDGGAGARWPVAGLRLQGGHAAGEASPAPWSCETRAKN